MDNEQPATTNRPAMLTVPEAARWLRVSKNTVYRAIRAGQLPHIKVSDCIRIPADGLTELMKQQGEAHGRSDQPGSIGVSQQSTADATGGG